MYKLHEIKYFRFNETYIFRYIYDNHQQIIREIEHLKRKNIFDVLDTEILFKTIHNKSSILKRDYL